ncbi:MAG: hypothetical protein KC493_12740 [Bacteriovoracaceae bacterium]|nr:hypothetical protein [Bacteriovoracaceae bacterium]
MNNLNFKSIKVFLFTLVFIPTLTLSSEMRKERLEFIKGIEDKIQRDIPSLSIEKRYTLYVDAARELHRFYFNDYAVKYLEKALKLDVKQSKNQAWVKLLGIYYSQNRTKTLKVSLDLFKKYQQRSKEKSSTSLKNSISFYSFVTSDKPPEEILSLAEISSLKKSFFKSEYIWISFDRYLKSKNWNKAQALVKKKKIENSSNWMKLKFDLINLSSSQLGKKLHCTSFHKKKDLSPENLMCEILSHVAKKKKVDPVLLSKFQKSLNALKPEYHWFYGLVKELQS